MGDEPVSVSPLLILNGWIGHCVLLHEGDLQAKRTACWTLCSLNFDARHCLYTLWFRARCAPRYLSITKGRALAVLHSRCSSCAGRNSRWSGGCLRKQCIESTNRQHCCPCARVLTDTSLGEWRLGVLGSLRVLQARPRMQRQVYYICPWILDLSSPLCSTWAQSLGNYIECPHAPSALPPLPPHMSTQSHDEERSKREKPVVTVSA